MDLLEYQAKALFREVGIPILPSQYISAPRDLKNLRISYPVVLKSQVRRGGRGKAGGVRFAENTIDAIAVAQTIFNLAIQGEYPEMLLAEVKYAATQEFYLAVALDRSVCRPVLLGSQQGGTQVESTLKQVQYVIVEQEFSPFYARRLAVKMGLQGALIQTVSEIIEKMYNLFRLKDLDLIEINPLGISSEKEVMALDGKVVVNDNALARHPDLERMVSKIVQITGQGPNQKSFMQADSHNLSCSDPLWVELDGEIAIVCNGAGLTMATLDMLVQAGGKPAGFLNLGGETHYYYPWASSVSGDSASPETLAYHRLEKGLELIGQDSAVKTILVNIFGSFISCDRVAEVLLAYLNKYSKQTESAPRLIVRLVGHQLEAAQERLANTVILLIDRLEEAVTQAVTLAKTVEEL
jgi:succinyl-CoA synthetase beta subunit